MKLCMYIVAKSFTPTSLVRVNVAIRQKIKMLLVIEMYHFGPFLFFQLSHVNKLLTVESHLRSMQTKQVGAKMHQSENILLYL